MYMYETPDSFALSCNGIEFHTEEMNSWAVDYFV